ncbi:MAG: UDP-N-acetylglucosamine 2-epimerase (non-hydrolyzing) [Elusimicrobia bacterium]|nr:UDP-N-acetylglucosamine 2-epimerase (non-hydrolyzing) [Elusimicrobiota bacterium]
MTRHLPPRLLSSPWGRKVKVLCVVGTRPEAIKMAPVIWRLKEDARFVVRVCATGQHRELLDDALAQLRVAADIDLGVMRPGQTSSEVLARVLAALDGVLAREKPGLVLVQGDTTSVLGGCLAAFHRGIPVGHVEAGLRTFDLGQPFPEEMNRVLVDRLAALLFAPTRIAARNLRAEGAGRVVVTGNTVVDALKWALCQPGGFDAAVLRRIPPEARVVAVTLHRHESFGAPIERACAGIVAAARALPALTWVYPAHPNPRLRSAARRLRHPRIVVCPPLGYLDFVRLMRRSEFLVTDSGGIQEEAACLGKAVLVAREKTERPEVLSGWGILVGTEPAGIVAQARRLAAGGWRPPKGPGPFGDGRAAERIRRAITDWARRRGT